jgi:hypothetical protein
MNKILPFDDRRAPGQAGAEDHHQDQVAALDFSRRNGLVQRNGHRRRRRVAVAVQIDEQLFRRGAEPFAHRVNDPAVGLMRNDAFDFREMSSSQRRNASCAAWHIACTAFLKVSLPSMRKNAAAATESTEAGQRLPPPGMNSRFAFSPSAPITVVSSPCEFGRFCKTAAPAPSPNSTQVLRSFQLVMDESFSAPMTSTVS